MLLWLYAAAASASIDFSGQTAAPGNLRFTWIHGSLSARANQDVRIQVHRYNEHTYILRQNPAVHWEAPFMYLLLGNDRAILLDTGATEEANYFPLRDTVDAILDRWQVANAITLKELIVLPLGSDDSQTKGMGQFNGRSSTRVVAPTAAARSWLVGGDLASNQTLDLGGREVHLLASPGLNAEAISVYDPWADLLFSGNAFYPGRLVVRDFEAFTQSINRLVAWSQSNPIKHVFGGRIEMTDTPGMDYILRTNYRPNERRLELAPERLRDCQQILQLINGAKDIHIHDDFVVMHGVGRGARAYGWPVFIPERFRTANTR